MQLSRIDATLSPTIKLKTAAACAWLRIAEVDTARQLRLPAQALKSNADVDDAADDARIAGAVSAVVAAADAEEAAADDTQAENWRLKAASQAQVTYRWSRSLLHMRKSHVAGVESCR
jgi:hypothetical protein